MVVVLLVLLLSAFLCPLILSVEVRKVEKRRKFTTIKSWLIDNFDDCVILSGRHVRRCKDTKMRKVEDGTITMELCMEDVVGDVRWRKEDLTPKTYRSCQWKT